jgi:hypothetical protein
MKEILQSQVDLAPQVYESELKYQPLYGVLQANQQAFQAQQALNMARQAYPQIADIEAAYNTANRQAELGQLQTALPAYQQAFNALTPGYAQAVAGAGQLAQQSMQQALARPQFASFEAGVRDPYGMPVAPQQAQATSAPAAPTAPAQPAPKASTQQQRGKGTPAPPTQAGFANQMQQQLQPAAAAPAVAQPAALPPTALQATPAGAYAGAVQDFTPNQKLPTNIQALDRNSVNQYIGAMPGMGQYANMLAKQAQLELAAGKSLTAEEQRIADQSVRAAYAARGTALGNQAISAEVLNRVDVANQRYQQRLENASRAAGTIQGIYQPALQQSLQRQQLANQFGLTQQELLQSAQAQRFQQAMGREELRAGTQQTAFQQALARGQAQQGTYMAGTQAQAGLAQLGAGTMSQLQSAQAPVLQAFYKQPILQGQQAQAQQMGMMMQQQAGPQYFNPESQTGMGSIYGAYNSQMNLAGAQAQANAAKQAGKSSMLGSLGGGLLGAGGAIGSALILCWVAREVYGEENPKWLEFRKWLISNADDNLLDAYIEHGEEFAAFISDKPNLKQLVKTWMDSKIS